MGRLTVHGFFAWETLVEFLGHRVLVEAKREEAIAVRVREGERG
jgi:hypothetical protein